MARRGGRITIRPQPKRLPPRGKLSAQRIDEGQPSAATRNRAAAGRLPLIRPRSEPRAPSPKGEGFLILIYRPNTDPKLLNQFEMFCTWVCRLLTVSIRAGSSVRTLFRASTSIFFSCAVISGRSCIMLSSWA